MTSDGLTVSRGSEIALGILVAVALLNFVLVHVLPSRDRCRCGGSAIGR